MEFVKQVGVRNFVERSRHVVLEESDDSRQLLERYLCVDARRIAHIRASLGKNVLHEPFARDERFQPLFGRGETTAHDDECSIGDGARVEVRVLFPGSDIFQFQELRTDLMNHKVTIGDLSGRKTGAREMLKLHEKPLERPDPGGRRRQRVILQLGVVLVKAIRRGLRGIVVIKVVEIAIDEFVKISLGQLGPGKQRAHWNDPHYPSHVLIQSNKRRLGFEKICYAQLLMLPEVAPIRTGEEIDARALREYLSGKVEGAEQDLAIEQFPGGHSNLTYLVRAGGREYVLRRPPLGPVAPKAHDMGREFRVLEAVHPWFPPAPKVFLLCEDASVIGATFFLMERRQGVVLRRDIPSEFARDPEFPRKASRGFIDCLALLHSIDIERHGLAALGRPEGFLDRQVRGWTERWERAKTEDIPGMEWLAGWLASRLPQSPRPTLVHNDFKLDN